MRPDETGMAQQQHSAEDYFALLDLPRQADLSEEEIQAHYHQRIAACHPDKATSKEERAHFAERATALNVAWTTLRHPASRVRHLLDLIAPDQTRDSSLAPELMELFARTGQALQIADACLSEKARANSALAKALLIERELDAQEQLQDALAAVTQAQNAVDFSATEPDALRELYTQLSFLEKWQSQLNERLLAFLVAET